MVTVSQTIFLFVSSWLLIIAMASRYNLQKYSLYVSTGLIIWKLEWISNFLTRRSKRKFWHHFGQIFSVPTLMIFLSFPFVLLLNLVLGFFALNSPIFFGNPVSILRIEIFILLLPSIFLVYFFHIILKALVYSNQGGKISSSGILIFAILISVFAQMDLKSLKPYSRLKVIASGVTANLLLLLVLLSLFSVSTQLVDSAYGESEGAIIVSIAPDSPAFQAGLFLNEVIIGLEQLENRVVVRTYPISSATEFQVTMRQIPAGTDLNIVVFNDEVPLITIAPPEDSEVLFGSYIGVEIVDYRAPPLNFPVLLPLWLNAFFNWSLNLCLVYSFYLLLPLPRSDGYEILESIASSLNLQIDTVGKYLIQGFTIALVVLNIILR